jgi:hypothetical protein
MTSQVEKVEGAEEAAAPAPVRISLKAICADLKIDPTAARRKLRAKAAKGADFRWEFLEEEVEGIKAILTAKAEKKEAAPAAEGEAAAEGETAPKVKKSKKSKKVEAVADADPAPSDEPVAELEEAA